MVSKIITFSRCKDSNYLYYNKKIVLIFVLSLLMFARTLIYIRVHIKSPCFFGRGVCFIAYKFHLLFNHRQKV